MRACSIEGCELPSRSRGLCDAHYARLRLGLEMGPPIKHPGINGWRWAMITLAMNFKADGCLIWPDGDARPYVGHRQRNMPVARCVLELKLGRELRGGKGANAEFCRHEVCDDKRCINPAHLSVGTPQENSDDAVRHGRVAVGSRHGLAKLDEAKVADIKQRLRRGDRQVDLAAEFGVDKGSIHLIAKGRTWKHVA